uniref:LTO1 maturation factor of ABCE1 n=1 Tax=Canis lupus familiaris TaxID=9615 RepID=A0A8C0RZL5_CANLF
MHEFAFSRSKIHWSCLRDFLHGSRAEAAPGRPPARPTWNSEPLFGGGEQRLAGTSPAPPPTPPSSRRACVPAGAAPAGPSREPSLPGLPRAAAPGSGLAAAGAVRERGAREGGGGGGARGPGAAMAGSQDMFDAIVMADESKKMKALESLIEMIQKFPYDDPTYDKLHEDLDKIRGKFKQLCSLLNVQPDFKISAEGSGDWEVACIALCSPFCGSLASDGTPIDARPKATPPLLGASARGLSHLFRGVRRPLGHASGHCLGPMPLESPRCWAKGGIEADTHNPPDLLGLGWLRPQGPWFLHVHLPQS